MKNKHILPLAAAIPLLLVACFSDKGNYDYTKIIEVTAPGLEPSYTQVTMQDVLHIDPVVSSERPGDIFAYLWTLGALSSPGLDTIGTESVLDYPVNLKQGVYEIILRVTNLANGHATYHVSALYVVTQFSIGLYLLKEIDDYTDLDLHLTSGEVLADLLEKSTDGAMPGKPLSLGVSFNYSYDNFESMQRERTITLNVCSEDEARIIRIADMTKIYTNRDFFLGDVSTASPYYLTHNGYGLAYITSEGPFFVDLYLGGAGKFGFASAVTGGCVPNIRSLVAGPMIFFYDDLNHRFLFLDWNGNIHEFDNSAQGGGIAPATPNNVPHEMLYFGHNYTSQLAHEGYAIFQDRIDPGKRYLYRLALNYSQYHNPITNVAEINPALKFNEATYFATNELDARVIYFLHDNQLYMYDVEVGSEELLAPEGLPADEEITYVNNRYYVNPADAEANFNHIAIGTHQAGRYKLYLYDVLGGKPNGAPHRILEGEGKVVKMQYITNKFLIGAGAAQTNNNYIPLSI